MTCYKGMMIDLKNSGAEVPDESVKVVIDGNLISSQHYHNNPEFMRAVLETYRLREEVVH
jgi:putative intracellular protease/amidase